MLRLQFFCMFALLFMVIPQESAATPPDIMTADIIMLGGSPEKAVFLVSTGFNLGSHYLWETRWFLLAMDLTDYSFEWESQGAMLTADEEYGGISFDRAEGAPTIGEALSNWNAESSFGFDGTSYFAVFEVLPDYFIRDSYLCARYGNEEYELQGARCFNPGNLAALDTEYHEFYIVEGSPVVREVQYLDQLPRFDCSEDGSVTLTMRAGAEFEDVYLLVATVTDDEAPFDVIFTIPLKEYYEAWTFLFEGQDSDSDDNNDV